MEASSIHDNIFEYFVDKISALKSLHSQSVLDQSLSPKCFVVTFSILAKVVYYLRPYNSPQDILPSHLFKETLHIIGPTILLLLDASLSSGCVAADFKKCIIKKKIQMFHLFMTKVAFHQLKTFLDTCAVCEEFQSGFQTQHKSFNDFLLT